MYFKSQLLKASNRHHKTFFSCQHLKVQAEKNSLQSVAEQPETSQPASEQRRRLFGDGQGRRDSGRAGGGGLLGRRLLVRDGGAVVEVGVNEALAASDVVDAADRRVSSVRQGITRLLLRDGVDPLVAQVSVQDVLTCSGDESHELTSGN